MEECIAAPVRIEAIAQILHDRIRARLHTRSVVRATMPANPRNTLQFEETHVEAKPANGRIARAPAHQNPHGRTLSRSARMSTRNFTPSGSPVNWVGLLFAANVPLRAWCVPAPVDRYRRSLRGSPSLRPSTRADRNERRHHAEKLAPAERTETEVRLPRLAASKRADTSPPGLRDAPVHLGFEFL